MHTILLAEDEDILREAVADYLTSEGFRVLGAANGKEAMSLYEESKDSLDLIILDIMMPELDGWSVCRRIRRQSDIPIIMLTARSDEEDTLLGFELGADDYVTKPFSPAILAARVHTLLKRTARTQSIAVDRFTVAGIQMAPSSREVYIDGQRLGLTHTEYEVLLYLIEHRELVVTREALITRIWGYEYEGDDRTINTHIRNLRSKLGDKAKHIVTVLRNGYKFVVDA